MGHEIEGLGLLGATFNSFLSFYVPRESDMLIKIKNQPQK